MSKSLLKYTWKNVRKQKNVRHLVKLTGFVAADTKCVKVESGCSPWTGLKFSSSQLILSL